MALDEEVKAIERSLKQETELGAVMSNLDSDTVDKETKMSNIDFNARLTDNEINASLIIDELIRLGIFPNEIGLTRQKKRLSVSKNGQGRSEKVAIVQGQREQTSGGGFASKVAGLFSRRE